MLDTKFRLGLWIGDENRESDETMFPPPIDDNNWQSPYILASAQEEPAKGLKESLMLFSSLEAQPISSKNKERRRHYHCLKKK